MSQRWNYIPTEPPSGIVPTQVKALYQFDGPDLGLTDRSGNGHDLASAVSAYTFIPMWAEFGCNMAHIQNSTEYLYSAPSALLASLGEATMEMVVMRYRNAVLDDAYNGYAAIAGPLDTEEDNCVFSLYASQTWGRLGVFIEEGAGVNVAGGFSGNRVLGPQGQLMYIAITRASDGKTYKYYANGNYVSSAVLSSAPTGGSTAFVNIGRISGSGSSIGTLGIQSFRWSHVEHTADQVLETYRRLRC